MPAESRARPSGLAVAVLGVVVLAAAGVLQLAGRRGSERGVCALLVDVSASVTRTRPDHAAWLAAELERLLRGDEQEGHARERAPVLVAFAGRARRLRSAPEPHGARLAADALAAAEDVLATDLASALDLVTAEPNLARLPTLRRLVVLGDGTWTGPDPAPRLASLVAAGVEVEFVRAPPPELPDVCLATWEVPARLPPDVAGVAAVGGTYAPGSRHGGAPPALELELAVVIAPLGGGETRSLRVPVPAPDALGAWRSTVTLPALPMGVYRVDARVLGAELDPVPENDVRSAILRVGAARRAVVLARLADTERASAWLRGVPGLAFEVATPERLTAFAPVVDVLATWDLDPAELPEAVLASFLRSGGTWIAAGGARWLQPRARESAAGAWSLVPLAPADEAHEPRTVVLLVDSSGSMAGSAYTLAVQSAARLVEVARSEDDVVAYRFTDVLAERNVLRTRGGEHGAGAGLGTLASWLSALRPGGPTDVVAVLAELADRAVPGEEALVFLLSDGRTDVDGEDDGQVAQLVALRARFAAQRLKLVVVAVGADADGAALARLAGGAEHVRSARALEELEGLFAREVRDQGTVAGAGLAPQVVRAAGLDETFLSAWTASAFGAFETALRCRLRPGGIPLLRAGSADGEGTPLVALERHGRGVAVAVAALPGADWAPAWAGASGWSTLAFAAAGEDGEPSFVRDGVLSVPGRDLPAVVLARIGREGRRGPGAAGELEILLTIPPGPTADRRVGELPAGSSSWSSERADSPWIVSLFDPATGRALGVRQVLPPRPREFEGNVLRLPEGVVPASAGLPSDRGHPAVPWLLVLGLCALVASAGLSWDWRAPRVRVRQASGDSRR